MEHYCIKCGKCCRLFTIFIPVQAMKKIGKRLRDWKFVRDWFKKDQGIIMKKPRAYKLDIVADCETLDLKTGLCKDYLNRPKFCKEWQCGKQQSTIRTVTEQKSCRDCKKPIRQGIQMDKEDENSYICYDCYTRMLMEV